MDSYDKPNRVPIEKKIKEYSHFSLTLYCFDKAGQVVADAQRIFDLEIPIKEKLLKEELDIFIRKLDAGNGDFTIPGSSDF